jgi:hypothetical protein
MSPVISGKHLFCEAKPTEAFKHSIEAVVGFFWSDRDLNPCVASGQWALFQ